MGEEGRGSLVAYYRKTCAEAFQLIDDGTQSPFIVIGDFLDDFHNKGK